MYRKDRARGIGPACRTNDHDPGEIGAGRDEEGQADAGSQEGAPLAKRCQRVVRRARRRVTLEADSRIK